MDEEIFSPVAEILRSAASMVHSGKRITLSTPNPTLSCSIAMAPLEAAFLDEGIPYRRIITNGPETKSVGLFSPFILIDPSIEEVSFTENNPTALVIGGGITTTSYMGQHGKPRNGILTPTAISHALAQLISPSGKRVRRMRPWLISGNWIHPSMDTTYDPVYTTLRDLLEDEGTISVVPLPEVPSPEKSNRPWVNADDLEAVKERWQYLDAEGRARAVSHIMRPGLVLSSPSTSRFEELGWHCILAPSWDSDLAGQIRIASSLWKAVDKDKAAGKLIDMLISKGLVLPTLSE
ncbi:MAG: hypothetical protein CMB53_03330 [Euryarchaeota archaeon]|nr:hypothetical protein [Euryarchaeota archaeon]